jgi:hypothetical protein
MVFVSELDRRIGFYGANGIDRFCTGMILVIESCEVWRTFWKHGGVLKPGADEKK